MGQVLGDSSGYNKNPCSQHCSILVGRMSRSKNNRSYSKALRSLEKNKEAGRSYCEKVFTVEGDI